MNFLGFPLVNLSFVMCFLPMTLYDAQKKKIPFPTPTNMYKVSDVNDQKCPFMTM